MADVPEIKRTDHLIPLERREPQPCKKKYRTFGPVEQTMYLDELKKHGRKHFGAARIGCHYQGIVRYVRANPEFAEEIEAAVSWYHDALVVEATRRAVDGVDEPLSYQGELTGDVVNKKSDRLLEKLLEAQVAGFSKKVDVEQRLSGGVLIVGQAVSTPEAWAEAHDDAEEIEAKSEVSEEDPG